MNKSIVAAVQFEPKILDVQQNLGTSVQLAHEAAAKGAGVVVLPELCMSGYLLNDPSEAMQCAQTRDGYQTAAFKTITKNHNWGIVFGYVELRDGLLYNSAAIVGPRGLEGNVQKHNLWGSDYLWACPSECVDPVTITRAGRLGSLICRDVINNYRNTYKFFNQKNRFYRQGSVDTLALLTNWSGEHSYPDNLWVELSEQTGANVIVSNRLGRERGLSYNGGSCVIDRNRKVWTNGSSFNDECIVGGLAII